MSAPSPDEVIRIAQQRMGELRAAEARVEARRERPWRW